MSSIEKGLSEALSNLKLRSTKATSLSNEEISKNLGVILQAIEEGDKKSATRHLISCGIVSVLSVLLQSTDKLPSSICSKIAELISELTKSDDARKIFTDLSIVGPLMDLLSSDDNQTVIQACCALGNICHDNDVARNLIKEQQGVVKLVHLLQRLVKMKEIPASLKNIVSGCLLNLSDAYEEIQEHAFQAGIVDVLLQYLERFYGEDDIASHCLLVLNCLADCDVGRNKLMESAVLFTLASVLKKNISEEVLESLLELFGNLSESDTVKLHLAHHQVCESLMCLMKKYEGKVGEDQTIFKTACDLIILVLTGDSSMEYLYMKGKGVVYKETMSWISSSDENLQISGALAAGNFARKDEHCIQMVKDDVPNSLLVLLQKHCGKDGDIRLQHAILSAMRNLAIPAENKETLAKLGVIDKILPMVTIETFPVVFKLLATLRMLVDKQEAVATSLGLKGDVVKQIVEWCSTDDHPGVQGEASRLLAWLIKNSKSKSVMEVLLNEGALPHLVAMVNSEHAVMQNEALVALTLLTNTVLGEIESQLKRTGVASALHACLCQTDESTEVLENSLAVTLNLTLSDMLKMDLVNSGVGNDLVNLSSKHPDSAIRLLSQKCLHAIGNL